MPINVIISKMSLFTISGRRDFAAKGVNGGLATDRLPNAKLSQSFENTVCMYVDCNRRKTMIFNPYFCYLVDVQEFAEYQRALPPCFQSPLNTQA